MSLAKILHEAREKSGLTQYELAKRLGYTSGQFVSNWERGKSRPPRHILKQLSQAVGVKVKIIKEIYRQEVISALMEKLR